VASEKVKFTDLPVVVVVWAMDGCPGCEEYAPIFKSVAPRYEGCVPWVILDAEKWAKASDHYRVKATPTTMILQYGRKSVYMLEGAGTEEEVDQIFKYASFGMGCELPKANTA
jgi:thioredoxin 2